MKNDFIKVMAILALTGLTACSTISQPVANPPSDETTVEQKPVDENTLAPSSSGVYSNNPQSSFAMASSNTAIGGNILQSMDANDKNKMFKGLDKAIGKSTSWANEATGIVYTINPTQKKVIEGNQFCRKYTLTATKGGSTQQVNEVACVGTDGEWHAV